MEKKLNILYVTRWYPDKTDPTFGLFVHRHAQSVSALCNVSLLYISSDRNQKSQFAEEYSIINDIHVIKINFKSDSTVFSAIINAFRYFSAYKKGYIYLKRKGIKPDLIHVNILTRAAVPALFLKWISGIPYIITEHWSRYLFLGKENEGIAFKGNIRKMLTKIIVRNADAVTTVTNNLREAMQKHGLRNKSYYTIPNVVDTDLFSPAYSKPKREKIVIIHISSLEDRSKNISGILRVIKRLSTHRQDFECRIIGDLNDKENLEKYSEELGIRNKFVFFDGMLSESEVAGALRKSDFLLMFSNYENFPVVINESLSSGVPVISTDVGGIREYISEDTGILVGAGKENELLSAVMRMMDSFQNYDKNKLREFAVNNFSKEAIGKQFYGLYIKSIS